MSDPLELQQQRQQQVQLTATQQLNMQRQNRTFQLQNEAEVFAQHQQQKDQILSRRAELYQMGRVKDMELERVAAPPQAAPPVSQLSERKRKKIDKKRKNNLKKAQKKHVTGATADTLPMMEQVKSFHKDMARGAVPMDRTFGFDTKLFSPDFPEEQECSIDVKKGMITLEKLRALRENPGDDPPLAIIGIRTNITLIAPLENALRTVLASNGVDMDTGNAITDARRVAEAKAARAQAVAEYEKAMANIKTTMGEQAENYFAASLQEKQEEVGRNDLQNRNPVTADLDFAFHYQPLEDEFVKTRESIDGNPEQYAAYKEIVDSRYQMYLDANRRIAEYGRRIFALKEQAKQYPESSRLRSVLEDRAIYLTNSKELDHLQSIAAQQYETIRYLMEGRPFSESMQYMYKILEDEYGIQSKQREEQKEELETFSQWSRERQEVFRWLPPSQQQDTMRMSKQISDQRIHRENVMEAYSTQLEHCGKDLRTLKNLLHGARVNETGAPLNVEEGRYMLEDGQRIRAYLSNDPAVSGPLLASVVEEISNYPYLEADVEEELKKRPAEFHALLNRNVYMQNMIADHPEYFSTLPKETMDRLDAAMRFGVAISMYAGALAAAYGVEFNRGEIYEEQAPVQTFAAQLDMYRENYETAKEDYRKRTGG